MRKTTLALSLMFSAGILLADSAFDGKWTMDQNKTNYTTGQPPKNESMNVSDQSGALHVTIIGTDDDGTPIRVTYVIPISGGSGQVQQGGSYNGVSATKVNDNVRDTTYSKDGRQLLVEHMVIATDGNTMTIHVKGVDSAGNPVEGTQVFDKQQ
jgi:hypothetical protein